MVPTVISAAAAMTNVLVIRMFCRTSMLGCALGQPLCVGDTGCSRAGGQTVNTPFPRSETR
jgi:hypothetical protein